MEVIGAASSIITVVQITGTLVSICYDYQSGTRHYPKDIVKITHELKSLRNVLERLADIANSQVDSASMVLPTLDSLNHPGGPLEICKVELAKLELKLTPAEGRLKQVGQVLAWPLKEKDVQKTLNALARQRGLFQLALTADQTTMTSAIKEVTSRTEGNLLALTERIQADAIDERRKQIFQWLAAPEPSPNHMKACQTRQQETGRWLLESSKYIAWKNQRASFLWVHGIPGCGKTVLCSTIIDDVASSCKTSVRNTIAYYYFDCNESKKQTCEGFARSLIAQLCGQNSENSKTMESLFAQCGEGQREPDIESLSQALRKLTDHFEEIYFVVDALDECVDRSLVILLIDEVCGWHMQNLHILVTSRKDMIIERGFQLLITDQIHIQNCFVDADIKLLVRECLHSDPQLSQWSDSIKAEVERTLYDGSKGMFRWAVCQLDTLRKCIKPAALRKALASLPRTLDETYERILCNIDEEHAEDALKVLQWLAFSARPLELQEVAEATAITLDDVPRFDPEDRLRQPTDILAICSSLISVSRPIRLPFGSSLPSDSSLPSPRPEMVSTYENSNLTPSQPNGEPSVGKSLECGSAIPSYLPDVMAVDEGTGCTDSRPEIELSDKNVHAASTVFAQDHPYPFEVRLAHDSVKEYLVSERIKGAKAAFYSISKVSTHDFLARSCLTYLMHFKQPLNDYTTKDLSEYPLLRYSAEEWDYHLTSSGDLSRDTSTYSILKEFFLAQNSSFANWLVMPFRPYYGNFQHMKRERVDEAGDPKSERRLYHASRLGLFDICKVLLEQGMSADPPTESPTGLVKSLSTPLQVAAFKGYEGVVRLLLDHGASVNQRSVHASTLDYAVAEGRESVVRLLLERGAEITLEAASSYYGMRGLATLVLAARAGRVSIVKLVLENRTYPKAREAYSEAYQEAIVQDHQDVADLLLEYGADPDYLTGNIDSDSSFEEYFDVGM